MKAVIPVGQNWMKNEEQVGKVRTFLLDIEQNHPDVLAALSLLEPLVNSFYDKENLDYDYLFLDTSDPPLFSFQHLKRVSPDENAETAMQLAKKLTDWATEFDMMDNLYLDIASCALLYYVPHTTIEELKGVSLVRGFDVLLKYWADRDEEFLGDTPSESGLSHATPVPYEDVFGDDDSN